MSVKGMFKHQKQKSKATSTQQRNPFAKEYQPFVADVLGYGKEYLNAPYTSYSGQRVAPVTDTYRNVLTGMDQRAALGDAALRDFLRTGPVSYSGDLTAPMNQAQLEALQSIMGGTSGAALYDPTISYMQDVLSGKYLDPRTAPGFSDYTKYLTDTFSSDILPAIKNEYALHGADLSSMEAKALGKAQGEFAGQLAQLGLGQYENERAKQQALISALPGVMEAGYIPAKEAYQAGALQQQDAQAALDRKYQEFLRGQNAVASTYLPAWQSAIGEGKTAAEALQNRAQQKADVAFQEYLRQQGFPEEKIATLVTLLNVLKGGGTGTITSTGKQSGKSFGIGFDKTFA